MKKMIRSICTVFMLLLVLSCAPIVFAAKSNPEMVQVTTPTISNPLHNETSKTTPALRSRRFYANEESYEEIIGACTSDYSAIVSALIEGMERRESQISLYYTSKDPLYTDYEAANLDNESFAELINYRWFAPLFADALVETESPVQGDYLRWVWDQRYCSFMGFYDSEYGMYFYKTVYHMSYYTTKAQEDQLTAAVNAVIDGFGFTEQTHNYQKISTIYNYITSNITYDYKNLEDDSYVLKHTAYAAMMNKTAVCQGYALLYYRMAKQCGIDTRVITGDSGGPHAWNISKLGNFYYNLDATWDAGMDEYSYFLRGSADFGNHTADLKYQTSAFWERYPIAQNFSKEPNPGDADFSYCVSGETAIITGYDGEALEITAPSTLDNYPVGGIGSNAFAGSKITKIILNEGIKTISQGAFSGSALTSITIPESINSIGPSAFSNCANLTDVYYPETQTQWCKISISAGNDDLINAMLHCKPECAHNYAPATCSNPKTCLLCQETEGSPLFHKYDTLAYNEFAHWHECFCGAIDEETFEHQLRSYYDEENHWLECSCGFVKDLAPHESDGGTVTKKATCTATGTKTYKCKHCGEVLKTETISKTSHKYTGKTCGKATKCSVCGKTGGKLAHSYSNDCDTKCNRCGKTRTIKHQYKSATCTKAKTCKVCGKTSGSKLGHKYSNDCDTSCNRCGKKRSITHDYVTKTTKATTSKNGKVVKKCAECGKVSSTKTVYKVKSFSLSTSKYTYSGAMRTPTVTVKDSKGKKLTKGTDYTVTYESGRTDVGEYTVTVTLKGKYSGSKKLYFTIAPKAPGISSLSGKSKSLVVKLKLQTEQTSGYQIEYSTSKSFKSSKKITVSDINTETLTIKSLKAKTTYYVRIRAYKTVDGEKIYSGWSSYQYKKTK